jgi:hypothetical protein
MITEMRFDPDSDTAKLFFKPTDFLSEEDWELAKKQGMSPSALKAIEMSVPKGDSNAPKLAAPKPAAREEAEPIAEPKKRPEKKAEAPTPKKDIKSIMSGWSQEEA